MSVSRWCFLEEEVLIVPVAFVRMITGRGGGWPAALLRGARTREGRFHVPGHHPTLTPIQVSPAKSPQIFFLILPYVICTVL